MSADLRSFNWRLDSCASQCSDTDLIIVAAAMVFTKLNNDVLLMILEYLSAKGLCSVSGCCSELNRFSTSCEQVDRLWRRLCERRWRLDERMTKVLGVCSMKDTYQLLAARNRIPKGKYTLQHNYIFGSSHSHGISTWILLQHNDANARVHRAVDGAHCWINVRICVQNVYHSSIELDLDNLSNIRFRNESNDCFTVRRVMLIGLDGSACSGSTDTRMWGGRWQLSALQFGVLQCEVWCPPAVVYETDFLAMVDELVMEIDVSRSTTSDERVYSSCHASRLQQQVRTAFVEEDELWTYYTEIPGVGVIMRSKPLHSY